MARRPKPDPVAGRWLIGHVFECIRSFSPGNNGWARLDAGKFYEVESFWNHGPILKTHNDPGRSGTHISWFEIENFGVLHPPGFKPGQPKAKKPERAPKPVTVWDRLRNPVV